MNLVVGSEQLKSCVLYLYRCFMYIERCIMYIHVRGEMCLCMHRTVSFLKLCPVSVQMFHVSGDIYTIDIHVYGEMYLCIFMYMETCIMYIHVHGDIYMMYIHVYEEIYLCIFMYMETCIYLYTEQSASSTKTLIGISTPTRKPHCTLTHIYVNTLRWVRHMSIRRGSSTRVCHDTHKERDWLQLSTQLSWL